MFAMMMRITAPAAMVASRSIVLHPGKHVGKNHESGKITRTRILIYNTYLNYLSSPTDVSGRFWSGELSARSNQDHQRDFEEKIMKQVANYVTKKTGTDQCLVQNAQPLGGSYVRLESEWKEMLKQRHSHHNIQGPNATGLSLPQSSNTCLGSAITTGGSSVSVMSKQKHK